MRIELRMRDTKARQVAYFLQRKYGKSHRAGLKPLIELLIADVVAEEAQRELREDAKLERGL